METRIFHPEHDTNAVAEAAAILRRGGLLGIPTETVYGLGADALNEDAVRRIFEAKGRPQDNPLIIHVPSAALAGAVLPKCACRRLSAGGAILARPADHDPAPPRHRARCAPPAGWRRWACAARTIPATLAIIEAAGVPIAAPSGNTSGRPSPTTAQHMMEDMDGQDRRHRGRRPLRRGGGEHHHRSDGTRRPACCARADLPLEALERVLGEVAVDDAVHRKMGARGAAPVPRA